MSFSRQSLNFQLWMRVLQCFGLSFPMRSMDLKLRMRASLAVRPEACSRSRSMTCGRSIRRERGSEDTAEQNDPEMMRFKSNLVCWMCVKQSHQRLPLKCCECTLGQTIRQIFLPCAQNSWELHGPNPTI